MAEATVLNYVHKIAQASIPFLGKKNHNSSSSYSYLLRASGTEQDLNTYKLLPTVIFALFFIGKGNVNLERAKVL